MRLLPFRLQSGPDQLPDRLGAAEQAPFKPKIVDLLDELLVQENDDALRGLGRHGESCA